MGNWSDNMVLFRWLRVWTKRRLKGGQDIGLKYGTMAPGGLENSVSFIRARVFCQAVRNNDLL